MKKLFIICALVTSAASYSYAQDQGGFGGGPGGAGGYGGRGQGQGGQNAQARTPEAKSQTYLETLMESFILNKEQRAQTLAILINENKSLDSLMATMVPPQGSQPQPGAAPDPGAMQSRQALMQSIQPKRKAIMDAAEAQFISVLSEKQRKLYLSSIKDRPETQGFGVTGGRGGQQGQGGQGRGQGGQGGFGGGGGGFGGGGGREFGGGGF